MFLWGGTWPPPFKQILRRAAVQNAIYHLHLSSSAGGTSEGLVVICQGSVNGADGGFIYSGHLTGSDEALSGKLTLKRWSPSLTTVFEALEDFDLQVSGHATPGNSFTISGGISSQPDLAITIAGRFLSAVNAAGAT
ncbi:MAG: hypothetical protein A3F77_11435 [Betaproteobacteria bacterium RIFCSPLOWO2_12_FULL_67_28]|nr:MAG: hypothetical protein A3F77_11435 [Betaproteobacteria bacterium RIFCSPLOWO2_12_FULL_67_28]